MKEFLEEIVKVIDKSEDKNITKIIKADFLTEIQEINYFKVVTGENIF